MTAKPLIVGVLSICVIGAGGTAATAPATADVASIAAGVPRPLDPPPPAPAPALPTAEELTGILNNLADPEVSDEVKSGLVAGGMDRHRANVLNARLRKTGHEGGLPLTFTVADITSTGPDTVTGDVTVTGPKLAAPISRTATFTNQGGWLLSQDSADDLVEEIVGRLPN